MKPDLLIASPQMRDPNFENALIVLCQHNEEGALGLVINRSCPISISQILEQTQLPDVPTGGKSALWGGPVGAGACFLIWSGIVQQDEGWSLSQGVAVSPSMAWLQKLVQEQMRFDIAIGYSGWGPGQLDEEIERGSWLYTEIDPEVIFNTPINERYDRALQRLGLSRTSVWMQPIDE